MKRYFFGYLFVKLSKVVAAVMAGFTVLLCLTRLWQGILETQSLKYEASAELRRTVAGLPFELAATQKFLSDHGVNVQSAADSKAIQSLSSSADFDRIGDKISEIGLSSERLKGAILARLEQSFNELEGKLRAHASSLKAEDATPTPKPRASTPPQRRREQVIPAALFSATMSDTERGRRVSVLRSAKEFLEVVDAGVEKPENKKRFAELKQSVESLVQLFQKPAVASEEKEKEDDPAEPVEPTSLNPADARTFSADKIADQLAAIKSNIRNVVATWWGLDRALDQARQLYEDEEQKEQAAARSIRTVWLGVGAQIAVGLFVSALLALFTLVVADVTQALLDTATNSGSSEPR